jgi:4-alpha-glucanotransferase
MQLRQLMHKVIISSLLLTLNTASCSQDSSVFADQNQRKVVRSKSIDGQSQQRIIASLVKCLPKEWKAREVTSEREKVHLAHIGKAKFELHLQATYTVLDTLFSKQLAKKENHTYVPEIVLHFYTCDEATKREVKFVQDNQLIISDLFFAYDFGETPEFLVYESNPTFLTETPDSREKSLRACLKNTLTVNQ